MRKLWMNLNKSVLFQEEEILIQKNTDHIKEQVNREIEEITHHHSAVINSKTRYICTDGQISHVEIFTCFICFNLCITC